MKRIVLIGIIVVFFSHVAFGGETILLTTTILSPYQERGDDGTLQGIAVELIRCALHEMNQPYELEVYPWKRAQMMVKDGDAQGFFVGSQNPERDAYATISAPVLINRWRW